MDRKRVLARLFLAHLPDRLQKHLSLDVADGAADFDDHHLRARNPADSADARLDLARQVGDRLDGAAQEVAAPFLGDDRLVDLPHGQGAGLGHVLVDEALVVAQVQVRLSAVGCHEHLAVLVGRHRAGVNVQIRVQLLDGDGDIAALEDAAQSGCGYAFADGANHSAGDEYVFGHLPSGDWTRIGSSKAP